MPDAGEVITTRKGAVAVITVSSPEVRNGLSPEMGGQLVAACDAVDADPAVGAVVVRGAGGTFCSGADTRRWDGMGDPASDEAYDVISAVYDAFVRVGTLGVPTIAAVRGAAVGAGLNLMLATDLQVVAEDARLIAGFVRIGIHPGGGFFTLAGRMGGRRAAAALGLFGEEVSGRRAVELGLAWEAVPDDHVEDRALELATRAAGTAPGRAELRSGAPLPAVDRAEALPSPCTAPVGPCAEHGPAGRTTGCGQALRMRQTSPPVPPGTRCAAPRRSRPASAPPRSRGGRTRQPRTW